MSTLTFYKNRSTPRVSKSGEAGRAKLHKAGEGPVTSKRQATPAEEKTIRNGGWVRTRANGMSPDNPKAKSSSLKGRPRLKKD